MGASVNGFGEIAESLRRSTVLINAGGRGNGSGVIWSSDGVIITNAHVAQKRQLRVQRVALGTAERAFVHRVSVRDLAEQR